MGTLDQKLDRTEIKKAVKYMATGENAKQFDGLKPAQMAAVVKSRNLKRYLPETKEKLALVIFVTRLAKKTPGVLDMIKEVRFDANGQVCIVAGAKVDNQDMAKAATQQADIPTPMERHILPKQEN